MKAVHTLAFLAIAGSILVVFADGVLRRPRRRTALAGAIAGLECAVFAGNGFVCPLTPLAEGLGDGRPGSVTDIFLPRFVARNLTWIGSSVLAIGVVLNLRNLVHPIPSGAAEDNPCHAVGPARRASQATLVLHASRHRG